MSLPEKLKATPPKSLDEFNADLEQFSMRGQWVYDDMLMSCIGGPKPAGIPYIWKWPSVYSKLLEACEVIPESYTARRSLGLINPESRNKSGATHTMSMAIQMVRPEEIAWAHRHTMAALRLVIKGNSSLFTVVDGEVCSMEDYDLVLTPQWTWHDHHNEAKDHAVWLDVLDVGLVLSLNAPFYETFPGSRQQPRKNDEAEYLQARGRNLRPTWEKPRLKHLPFRYSWKETEKQLQRMKSLEGNAYDGLSLEYVNPMTGGPALPTLGCWVQMLRPGEKTLSHRHTSSAVYFVIRGEGTTVAGDRTLEWEKHDAFCLPNWTWHQHINRSSAEDAILFSVNDVPMLDAFDLYREEPENSLQAKNSPAPPSFKSNV